MAPSPISGNTRTFAVSYSTLVLATACCYCLSFEFYFVFTKRVCMCCLGALAVQCLKWPPVSLRGKLYDK